MQLLEAHTWPGNVRELQSTLKYALVHAAGDLLTPECLPESFRGASSGSQLQPAGETWASDMTHFVRRLLQSGEADIYRKVGLAVDRVLLEEVLRHVRGNQGHASELLGISRTTLRLKLKTLGLAVEKQLLPDSGQPSQKLPGV
jgi:two-component system nitrogen regulation response regulator GlnG